MNEPTVPSSAQNVVDNILYSQKDNTAWDGVAHWRIDMAHRSWSTSSDYPDELLICMHIPPDSATSRSAYRAMTARERS